MHKLTTVMSEAERSRIAERQGQAQSQMLINYLGVFHFFPSNKNELSTSSLETLIENYYFFNWKLLLGVLG